MATIQRVTQYFSFIPFEGYVSTERTYNNLRVKIFHLFFMKHPFKAELARQQHEPEYERYDALNNSADIVRSVISFN